MEKQFLDCVYGDRITLEDLKTCLGVHENDFNISDLLLELHKLPKMFSNLVTRDQFTLAHIQQHFVQQDATVKHVFSEVQLLLTLLMTIPASVASAERSHSALKRLKTYLRSTMTEERLTHLLLLHVHKNEAAAIDLEEIFTEFVSRTTERRSVFYR
jgi:hypothetical protein